MIAKEREEDQAESGAINRLLCAARTAAADINDLRQTAAAATVRKQNAMR